MIPKRRFVAFILEAFEMAKVRVRDEIPVDAVCTVFNLPEHNDTAGETAILHPLVAATYGSPDMMTEFPAIAGSAPTANTANIHDNPLCFISRSLCVFNTFQVNI